MAVKSVQRLRSKLKMMLRQWRGQTLASTVTSLAPILRGWLQCFSPVQAKGVVEELEGWMRRKLTASPGASGNGHRPASNARCSPGSIRSAHRGRPTMAAVAGGMQGPAP